MGEYLGLNSVGMSDFFLKCSYGTVLQLLDFPMVCVAGATIDMMFMSTYQTSKWII